MTGGGLLGCWGQSAGLRPNAWCWKRAAGVPCADFEMPERSGAGVTERQRLPKATGAVASGTKATTENMRPSGAMRAKRRDGPRAKVYERQRSGSQRRHCVGSNSRLIPRVSEPGEYF